MIRSEERETGAINAVSGSSQCGKSTWVLQEIEDHQRVLVWDTSKPQYAAHGFQRITSLQELYKILRDNPKGKGRYAYQGRMEDFDAWCWAALAWVKLFPATLVVEESSDVTHQGKAPDGYGEIIRKLMGLGGHLFDITQSPAESTKTIWRNATRKHTHYLSEPADRESVAARLDCNADEIKALAPYEFLERDTMQGGPHAELVKGKTRK
jgi:hypothetical protein